MVRRCALLIALGLLALALSVQAAGFHIHEQGAKAMGMGNAFVAVADDPSAIFFNPAGLAFQEGTRISLGVTTIFVPETQFNGRAVLTPGVSEEARSDLFFPPNLYFTRSLNDSPLSFGFGINSQFPLAKRWADTSAFRDVIKEISIKPLNFNPTVSYQFRELNLSVGAGIDYTWAQVWLNKHTNPLLGQSSENGELELEGDGGGWGYNLGALWKPCAWASVGVAYRSEIELDLDGDYDWRADASATAESGDASATITLPDSWSLGIAVKPLPRLLLSAEADRFGWSSYERLKIDLLPATAVASLNSPKDWKDVWTFRFGGQYSVTDNWDLRLGYAYDNTPQPDATVGPELPDADRHNFTVGAGYHDDGFSVDVAYMYVLFRDRTVDNSIQTGTYKSDAHLVAANLTYSF